MRRDRARAKRRRVFDLKKPRQNAATRTAKTSGIPWEKSTQKNFGIAVEEKEWPAASSSARNSA